MCRFNVENVTIVTRKLFVEHGHRCFCSGTRLREAYSSWFFRNQHFSAEIFQNPIGIGYTWSTVLGNQQFTFVIRSPGNLYPSPVHACSLPFATGSSRDSLVSTRRASFSIAGSSYAVGGNGFPSGIIDLSPDCRQPMVADGLSSVGRRPSTGSDADDDDSVFQCAIHETPI